MSSRKAARPAAGTRERILDGALELLNNQGGAESTTNHIAAHLGMSPGNLYYHFRNREEIVRGLFPRLAEEGYAATAAPEGEGLSAREFGARHIQGLEVLWKYRFFYRDLNQLVARDPELQRAYFAYHERLSRQYLGLFERLVEQGDLCCRDKVELVRLVTASLLIWFNWIPRLVALYPQREISRSDTAEGALHSFLVIEPHLERDFAAETRRVIVGSRRRRS